MVNLFILLLKLAHLLLFLFLSLVLIKIICLDLIKKNYVLITHF